MPALVVVPFVVEYFVNRKEWVRRGTETLTTMMAVFVAVIFAVVQAKNDRATERMEDAYSLLEGSEQETGMIMNRLFAVLQPGIYIESLEADSRSILIRSDIDIELLDILWFKSNDLLVQLLLKELPLSAQVITNPIVLRNLNSKLVNAFMQANDDLELWRRQFDLLSNVENVKKLPLQEHGGVVTTMFHTVESIDHLRMVACAAKSCLAEGGANDGRDPCGRIQEDVTTFQEMLDFADTRIGCKRRFYWKRS